MQHTAMFRLFMQELVSNLDIPCADSATTPMEEQPAAVSFKVEIVEGPTAGEIVFRIGLGISAEALNADELRSLLAYNQPQSDTPFCIVGLPPGEQDICLWCHAPADMLRPANSIDILKRLVHQGAELKKKFAASAASQIH